MHRILVATVNEMRQYQDPPSAPGRFPTGRVLVLAAVVLFSTWGPSFGDAPKPPATSKKAPVVAPVESPTPAPEPPLPADLTTPPDGVRVLTLEESLRDGLARNPTMKVAAEKVVKARARYQELKSAKNPKIGIDSGVIAQPQISIDSTTIFPNGVLPPGFPDTLNVVNAIQSRLHVALELLLTTFGRVENQIAAALVGIGSAAQQAASEQRQLTLDVKRRYFARLRAEATVRVSALNLDSSKQMLSDTEARFKQGLLAKYDVLQAELDVTDASQRKDVATSEMVTSNTGLESVLFAPPGEPLWAVPAAPISIEPDVAAESLKGIALAHRPEVLGLDLDLLVARRLLAAAQADNNPTLSFGLNYSANWGNNLLPSDAKNAMLQFSWPILDGGQRAARVKAASSDLRTVEASIALVRQSVSQQVSDAWQRLLLTRQNLATAESRAQIASQYFFLARQRFIHGVGTSLEMQSALRALNDARLALVVAGNDVDLAFAEVEQSLGVDFPDRHLTLVPGADTKPGGTPK